MSIETKRIVGGHHTRKTASFVRACAAYCFITVPSISSLIFRLELYLLSGQVALCNQCLGQGECSQSEQLEFIMLIDMLISADACFKAALNLITDIPTTIDVDGKQKSSDSYLVSYMSNFMSTLLIVPVSQTFVF